VNPDADIRRKGFWSFGSADAAQVDAERRDQRAVKERDPPTLKRPVPAE
jgi:hypothetical protein